MAIIDIVIRLGVFHEYATGQLRYPAFRIAGRHLTTCNVGDYFNVNNHVIDQISTYKILWTNSLITNSPPTTSKDAKVYNSNEIDEPAKEPRTSNMRNQLKPTKAYCTLFNFIREVKGQLTYNTKNNPQSSCTLCKILEEDMSQKISSTL